MRRSHLLLALVMLLPALLAAQPKYTISGYVTDAENGESMFSATIQVPDLIVGTSANTYGFYSLTLDSGTYTLLYSFLGYETFRQEVRLVEDRRINVELRPKAILTDEVSVVAKRGDAAVDNTEMGTIEMQTEEIKNVPALLGEVDILRTLQLLPGVQGAGEGNSGLYVRGGGPDQNLILLDDAIVYNTGHLFGFFSIFNSDAISSTTLIKGGMPAQYGGRLSSVVDVTMKEGNNKKFQVEGGIGLISSRLTVQGPIKKDKTSFIVSGRRTYIDLLLKPFLKRYRDGDFQGNSYYFYDVNAKLNHTFSDKDRLYISGYFGRDVFKFKSVDDGFNLNFPWGNATATIRWNHLFNDKLFMNAMGIYNDFDFQVSSEFQDVTFELISGVRDFGSRLDFYYYPAPKHQVRFGGQYTYHRFTPYSASGQSGGTEFETSAVSKKFAHDAAAYIRDDYTINDWLRIQGGLRFSYFAHVGPLEKVVYDDQGRRVDTLSFTGGEKVADYAGLEPRVTARIKLTPSSSVKLSWMQTKQYTHLVSSSTTTLPSDLWVPSSAVVKPQKGMQVSAGYFKNFQQDMWETHVQLYYKRLKNQIEYGETAVPDLDVDIEDLFVFGDAWSYGAEFFVNKRYGDLTGWVGYTLAFTDKRFPDLNNDQLFPAKYDRRHDVSLVASYEINDRWRISSTFIYGTGQATTVPVGRYLIGGQLQNQYGDKNGYRLASYHRLDFAAVMVMPRKKHYSDLTFAIYNVYNRKNPFFIFYDIDGDLVEGDLDVRAKQVSLFPILPSITWNFKY